MKNKLSFLVAVMTLSVIFNLLTQSSSHAAATGCKKTDDSTAILVTAGDTTPFTLVGTSGYDQDQCSQEPDEYLIKFYKVALCREDPYKGAADPDFSSCADIFNNATGADKILEPNTETDLLDGDLLLPVGTYPYLVVIVDNHLKIKHKQKYVLASDGTSAATIIGQGGGGSNTGAWCWSRAVVTTYTGLDASAGDDHPTDYDTDQGLADGAIKKSGSTTSLAQLACASSEPSDSDVVFATEIIDDLQDGENIVTSDFLSNFDYYSALEETGVAGIEMAQNLLKNDSLSIATTPNNARRLLSHFKYASPVVISDSTVGFKLRFSTYSSVSIDMSVPGGSTDIYGAKVGADPFMVQVQTKTKRTRGTWR